MALPLAPPPAAIVQPQLAPAELQTGIASVSLAVLLYLVAAKSTRNKEVRYAGKIPPNGVNKLKLIMEAREKVTHLIPRVRACVFRRERAAVRACACNAAIDETRRCKLQTSLV